MKTRSKWIVISTVLIMLLALLMLIPQVSSFVGEKLKVPGETIRFYAELTFAGALGVFLINAGVASLALPVVGIGLIVIGLVLLAWSGYRVYQSNQPPPTNG